MPSLNFRPPKTCGLCQIAPATIQGIPCLRRRLLHHRRRTSRRRRPHSTLTGAPPRLRSGAPPAGLFLDDVACWPLATDDGWHKMWAYGVRAEVTDARLKRRSSPHGDMARGRSGDNATNRQPVSCKGPDHPIRQDIRQINPTDASITLMDEVAPVTRSRLRPAREIKSAYSRWVRSRPGSKTSIFKSASDASLPKSLSGSTRRARAQFERISMLWSSSQS